MLTVIGVPLDKLKFVQGTSYQLSREYSLDMYKMAAITTTEHTSKAGAEVVKQMKNPLMSSLIYPILQALDEEYLKVDIQFGGVDQRKIFMFAREWLPKIGYKKRNHLMNSLIPGLTKSGKMSSSEPLSKIDFDESDDSIHDKFKQAYSVDGQPDGNGMLALLKHILLRRVESQGRKFIVKRPAADGGDKEYTTYEEIEEDFKAGKLLSQFLKPAVAEEVIALITPLRQAIEKNKKLMHTAYPPEEKKESTEGVTSAATIGSLDLRVGKVVSVQAVPKSTEMYHCKIDVGEEAPRDVLAKLVKWLPAEKLLNRLVIVICNLPPRPMLGITSKGMLLGTSIKNGKDLTSTALVEVPADTPIGERLVFDVPEKPDPELTQKRLDRIFGDSGTDAEGHVVYKKANIVFKVSTGNCTSPLKDALLG